ncbi:hypothetical protein QAD02_005804 [Eretmocerus hayati]|uniref:Uncharacterized protein n=1 Tax=Eretmocerus hayati TaxID=131215 RepID=A0ACC2NTV0_9HYME|nr:hypothetical protein QAD02_005804 [Eretmocerus hayati]
MMLDWSMTLSVLAVTEPHPPSEHLLETSSIYFQYQTNVKFVAKYWNGFTKINFGLLGHDPLNETIFANVERIFNNYHDLCNAFHDELVSIRPMLSLADSHRDHLKLTMPQYSPHMSHDLLEPAFRIEQNRFGMGSESLCQILSNVTLHRNSLLENEIALYTLQSWVSNVIQGLRQRVDLLHGLTSINVNELHEDLFDSATINQIRAILVSKNPGLELPGNFYDRLSEIHSLYSG